MAARASLSAADIAHRVTVSALAGLSVYGLYGMYATHTATMKAGEEAWAKHLAEEAAKQKLEADPLLKGFVDPPPERPS
ncbi:cytochrome c oxidase assembly protein COX14 [Rhodotorula paludigena]|uniref:ATP synthase subunit e, mitochondrial n=1 Tax=Rhodotorula paludigena TaxID=86838 RepID=A0AAV5GHE8_9BASI|nr:hypothetical protein Rhopal_000984-T1 [Rhodotorula paludigena]